MVLKPNLLPNRNSLLFVFTIMTGFLPTSQSGVINYVGECGSESYLCGMCEGDCDNDENCSGDLVCVQRSGNEPIQGCTGEGGDRDMYGKDICVQPQNPTPTPPTPTPPTPTAPISSPVAGPAPTASPTSNPTMAPTKAPTKAPVPAPVPAPVTSPVSSPVTSPTCNDTSLRIRFRLSTGKWTRQTCQYVAQDPSNRCKLNGVSKACPSTCGTCGTCVDTPLRYRVSLNNRWRWKVCKWVRRAKRNARCKIPGVADTCRQTCGTC